jgi:hypothetical protein
MYHRLINPQQWLLDGLLKERLDTANQKCHDCGVSPGETHIVGCDTARCLICGGQYLGCDCGEDGFGDVWDGLWPGTRECYENGFVSFCDLSGTIGFDFNQEAKHRMEKMAKK